jgi:hypothetical protein
MIVLRMYVLLPGLAIRPNQVLTFTTSVAIWNWKKIVITIAAGVWGINIRLLIQGKPRSPIYGSSEIPFKNAILPAIVRVNNYLELQWTF